MLAIEHRSTSNFIFGASNTKSKIACFKIFHVWPTKWLRPQLRWPGAPQWQRRIFTTNQAPSFFSLTPLVGHHRFKEDRQIIWMALCCLRNSDDISPSLWLRGGSNLKQLSDCGTVKIFPRSSSSEIEKRHSCNFFFSSVGDHGHGLAHFFDTFVAFAFQIVWWYSDCGALVRYVGVSGGAGLEMAMSVVVVVVLLFDMVC